MSKDRNSFAWEANVRRLVMLILNILLRSQRQFFSVVFHTPSTQMFDFSIAILSDCLCYSYVIEHNFLDWEYHLISTQKCFSFLLLNWET